MPVARTVLLVWVWAVLGFLLLPILVAAVLSFSSVPQLRFPPPGFSLQWYAKALASEEIRNGLWLSLGIAAVSSFLSAVAGTLASVSVNHFRFPGRDAIRSFLLMPLVVPSIVTGLGLLQVCAWARFKPGFWPTVVGHSVLGIPYVAYLVLAALSSYDLSLEHASRSLGATRAQTLRFITVPLLWPGILAGTAMAFLMSLDNVALSIFLSRGNTLPLRLMQHIQYYADPTVAAVATAMVAVSGGVMLVLWRVIGGRDDVRVPG